MSSFLPLLLSRGRSPGPAPDARLRDGSTHLGEAETAAGHLRRESTTDQTPDLTLRRRRRRPRPACRARLTLPRFS